MLTCQRWARQCQIQSKREKKRKEMESKKKRKENINPSFLCCSFLCCSFLFLFAYPTSSLDVKGEIESICSFIHTPVDGVVERSHYHRVGIRIGIERGCKGETREQKYEEVIHGALGM